MEVHKAGSVNEAITIIQSIFMSFVFETGEIKNYTKKKSRPNSSSNLLRRVSMMFFQQKEQLQFILSHLRTTAGFLWEAFYLMSEMHLEHLTLPAGKTFTIDFKY